MGCGYRDGIISHSFGAEDGPCACGQSRIDGQGTNTITITPIRYDSEMTEPEWENICNQTLFANGSASELKERKS
jgi:hypothetical protein